MGCETVSFEVCILRIEEGLDEFVWGSLYLCKLRDNRNKWDGMVILLSAAE
jgi:hypothetical protein